MVGTSASADARIVWDAVVDCADKYFALPETPHRAVTIRQTGTYQLNLNVTHESSMRVAVHIQRLRGHRSLSSSHSSSTSFGVSTSTRLEPTLVQFYETKQRVSRLDQVLELHADDQVSVHLTPALTALPQHVRWLAHFAPQPNLLLKFLDHALVYRSDATAST